MYQRLQLIFLFFLGFAFQSWGQQQIEGVIVNADTGEPLEFVTIYESISGDAVLSDGEGSFVLEIANQDSIRLEISYLGFRSVEIVSELESVSYPYRIAMISEAEELDAVVVQASAFKDIIGVPVSLKTTESALIRNNPGGGGDFAKVIQSLPGLTSLNSFRNDLIIRGGAPTENAFFVDDIEIPVINHLTTQGSTGGTISLLNSQHIREVDLIASGYPPNRPDAMSGVFNIYLTDGDEEKTNVKLGMDPTNAFSSMDGSIGSRLSYVGGLRRSYRQYILDLLGLATLPIYNDYLFKLKYRFKKNAELSFLLLGAVDRFKVNEEVNESEIQQYLQANLPSNKQRSSTTGFSYKWIGAHNYHLLSVSYSDFYNEAEKSGRVLGQESQILAYNSREEAYNARFESYKDWGRLKIKYGAGYRHSRARYDVYNQFFLSDALTEVDYVSSLSHNFYFGFGQLTYEVIPDRLELTLNQLMQISDINERLGSSAFDVPKLNGSLVLSSNLSWNFSVGSYRQLPENILLGYLEDDELVNIDQADFIQSTQFTTGIELDSRSRKTQFLVEGYYKKYNQYPFNTRDNISLANFGADFGVIGNVPVQFEGTGTSYGLELFLKRASSSSLHGWLSYTWGISEFEDRKGQMVPSSWDARHIFNAVIIRDFSLGWSLGLNFKYQSALPYTPFREEVSSLVQIWDVNRIGIRDFSRINSARGKSLRLLDLRLGKSYQFEKSKLLVYLDLENVFADADSQQALILDRSRSPGQDSPVITNPLAPQSEQRYALKEIQNAEGVFIPSVGFEWSF